MDDADITLIVCPLCRGPAEAVTQDPTHVACRCRQCGRTYRLPLEWICPADVWLEPWPPFMRDRQDQLYSGARYLLDSRQITRVEWETYQQWHPHEQARIDATEEALDRRIVAELLRDVEI